MLGFSLQKLLVLAAIIAAVWYGFKFVGRIDRERKAGAKASIRGGRGRNRAARDDDVEEMVRCETCGSFVAGARAGSCGRDDCPFPG